MENKFKLGYVGLGKMGLNMVERLLKRGHRVVATDPSTEAMERAAKLGTSTAGALKDLVAELTTPRLIWLMVPNEAVDSVLEELVPLLNQGDTIIDGGNTRYNETKARATSLTAAGINFIDVGVSGGPGGARDGACLMIGGDEELYKKYEELFRDIAAPEAYGYFGAHGAGHFVKMVHNGIEYGMMQALAEGFELLKKSEFQPNLEKLAKVYNNKSVIESRLVGWLVEGFERYGEDLEGVSGTVAHTGEGKWTVETAKELGVPVPIIEGALKFRDDSKEHPSYTGQVLSVLRNMFGGHAAGK